MRIAAIIFIVLSVGANFYFNNLSSLVLAMFSFPVLVWLLVKKSKRRPNPKVDTPLNQRETKDIPFTRINES